MKNLAGNLLLVLVSLLVMIGFAEVATRIVDPTLPAEQATPTTDDLKGILVFDDRLETRYRPGASALIRSPYGEFEIEYAINELGLRDRPFPGPAGEQPRRILALGNSFAEGWGVSLADSFLSVAERQLNAARARSQVAPLRMVRAGISGYGAAQSYLLFEELLPRAQPELVVFFYVSTMVSADHGFLSRADVDAVGLATGLDVDALLAPGAGTAGRSWIEGRSAVLRRLTDTSMLARFVVARIRSYLAVRRVAAGDPQSDLLAGIRADPRALPDLHDPSLRHVRAIAERTRAAGKSFLLVHLPMPHQVSASAWSEGRTAYGLAAGRYDAPDREVVEAFCARAGLACIAAHDVLSARAGGPGAPIYYRYDFHLNASGNAVLGRWLGEQIGPLL